MSDPLDALEAQMTALRSQIRGAIAAGEPDRTPALRAQLLRAERAWDTLVDVGGAVVPMPVLTGVAASSVRDRVHQVLALLMVPASPALIDQVLRGLWNTELGAATSLRRDEERSWRSRSGARAFYVVPALHHGSLKPVRALLTLSTWELEQRVVTPRSELVHHLIVASRVADMIASMDVVPTAGQAQLLTWLAAGIPGALQDEGNTSPPDPRQIRDAAELALRHHDTQAAADELIRAEAALRLKSLPEAERLFGART